MPLEFIVRGYITGVTKTSALYNCDQGFRGDGTPPELTDEVRIEAAKRYIQAYELITGQEFVVYDEPIQDRIKRNLGL